MTHAAVIRVISAVSATALHVHYIKEGVIFSTGIKQLQQLASEKYFSSHRLAPTLFYQPGQDFNHILSSCEIKKNNFLQNNFPVCHHSNRCDLSNWTLTCRRTPSN